MMERTSGLIVVCMAGVWPNSNAGLKGMLLLVE